MAVKSVSTFGVLIVLGMIVAGCASDVTPVGSPETPASSSAAPTSSPATPANSSAAQASSSAASTKNREAIAHGSVEDSLNACQARIPKDASAGQRMLAEDSCRRGHAQR